MEPVSPLEVVMELLGDGVVRIADAGSQIAEGRLLTGAAWLRRARKLLREAQELLGDEIKTMEGGDDEDSGAKG